MNDRGAYAHTGTVRLTSGAADAVAAAITVALCGRWDHDGPCPLAPHHTSWHPDPSTPAIIHTRTIYAVQAARQHDAVDHIREGLAAERLVAPDGATATWRLLDDRPSPIEPHEVDHADRLAATQHAASSQQRSGEAAVTERGSADDRS
jgi:hypothetical protein